MVIALLGRCHSPCVDIEVRVDLDRGSFQTNSLEQQASRRSNNAFAATPHC